MPRVEPRRAPRDALERRCWRPRRRPRRAASLSASASRTSTLDAVRVGVPPRRFERRRVVVDGEHRPEARAAPRRSRARRSRSRRRAELPRSSSSSSSRQRRVVACAAGAERAPGSITIASRRPAALPRRADPEPPDAHRPVEVAPALLPAGTHVVGAHLAEGRPEPLLARVVGVRDQLEAVGVRRAPRSPAGRARASAPAPPRHARRGATERPADAAARSQRNALFSFSKNPSSRLVRLVAGAALELLEQVPLLVGQRAAAPGR